MRSGDLCFGRAVAGRGPGIKLGIWRWGRGEVPKAGRMNFCFSLICHRAEPYPSPPAGISTGTAAWPATASPIAGKARTAEWRTRESCEPGSGSTSEYEQGGDICQATFSRTAGRGFDTSMGKPTTHGPLQ
ncbi:hypothetical protein AAFF_G00180640 [Aldrovandia affinis]|uniref:Uncharacterized protein n=1 Tax=Aldrovandia affinis TaxID=143900 RepID=A0AAD7WWP4_9TELE|nr:hypothetical protein AAFF_G00180640 [Aldrovandia affinis]